MDKKEIYEHLAKIYLDASLSKNKKKKEYPRLKTVFFFAVAVIFSASLFILPKLGKDRFPNSEIALVLQPELAKINFNFNPAKKEIYSVNLNKLNLAKYKAVAFSVKKANYRDTTALKIEFSNIFKENSVIYIKDIPHRWQEYRIALNDFKGITDWSEMREIAFVVEQWNTKESHGVVYLENIRFIK